MGNQRLDTTFSRDFAAAWDPSHLHLILMPTEQCNFRCVYCYEDFRIGKMKSEVLEGVKSLLETRVPSLNSLEINWFGGEPTVALKIVFNIMAHAQHLCAQYNVRLRAGMTTNGYLLTSEVYRKLVQLNVTDYQISLDGPKEIHDTTRLQANKKGSYDQIMQNLLAIRDTPGHGEILLRVHLTKRNQKHIPPFAEYLKAEFGFDDRFKFTIQPVENLGSDRDLSDLVIENNERRWGENSHPVSDSSDGSDGMERKHDDTYVCYAAKGNSIVIRADGRLGKCTVALNSDYNTVGSLKSDGTMEIDEDKIARWFSGWETKETSALACPAATVFK